MKKTISKYAIFDSLMTTGTIEHLRETLKEDLDPNLKSGYGDTPITMLVEFNFSDFDIFLDMLLKKGANIDIPNKLGYSPLMVAANNERYKIIRILISRNADWNIINSEKEDFLDILYKVNKIEYYNIILEFPKKYKEYLIKKDVIKYNI